MIARLLGVLVIVWGLGFAIFALQLARPANGRKTDGIVVPTGGAGRVQRGLSLLRTGQAQRLLVTGVAPNVRPVDLATTYDVPLSLFACCVDLGRQAVDTRSNADETAGWVRVHGFHSLRLVTSDWHMARARMELENALAGNVDVLSDGVPSEPSFGILLGEYNKLILRRIALWAGWNP